MRTTKRGVWTLDDRYELTTPVASGVTGDVWQALDRGTGRPVAVKLLHPYLAADQRLTARLLRARQSLTALWHPGIARLLDIVVTADHVGLVSDLVDGPDLGRLLDRTGPLPPARAGIIAETMADALAAAHRVGIVHGDVKPSNVLVPRQVGGPAQLTDFSVALLLRPAPPAGPPVPDAGHSPYTAPEVIDGAVPAQSSDVYALGAVLQQMLTGAAPGEWPRLPPGQEPNAALLEIISRCGQPEPAARPPAETVYHQLRDVTVGLAAASPPGRPGSALRPLPRPESYDPPPREPAARRRPRRRSGGLRVPRGLLVAATAAAVLALAVVVVRALGPPGPEPAAPAVAGAPGGPQVAVPVFPPAAAERTAEGGAEFVRYWFDQVGYATGTGDTAPLAEVTDSRCEHCRTMIEAIESAYADGGSLVGGEYVMRRVFTNELYVPDRPLYDVVLDRAARTLVDASGAHHPSLPPVSFFTCLVLLEWTGQRWVVRDAPTADCLG